MDTTPMDSDPTAPNSNDDATANRPVTPDRVGDVASGGTRTSEETGDPESPTELTKRPDLDAVLTEFGKKPVADSTRAVYDRHWRRFVQWCEGNGFAALPATPRTVQMYAIAAKARGLSLSTIRGRLAAVRFFHRDKGHEDPTSPEIIENTLEHLARKTGSPVEPKKALSADNIATMVRALPGAPSSTEANTGGTPAGTGAARFLRGVRDRALILVGFAGALRRSEIAGMRVEHLRFNPDGFELHVPRSKGDQEGEGAWIGVSRGESVDLCPRRALRRWLRSAGIESGPVFRGVPNDGMVAPDHRARSLSGQAIADVVKRAADAAGLDPETYSGHSLRRGHLTTAARNGAALPALQRQARHADPRTTAEYIEDANRMETNTSRHLGL